MRLCGMLLIMTAALGMGFGSGMELARQEKTLKEILQMLLLLKGEIRYGNVTLKEACLDVSERMRGTCRLFLKDLSDGIPGPDFGGLFAACVDRHLKTAGLSAFQLEPLYLLGNRLGYLDVSVQIRQLELCEESLGQMLARMQKELPQKQKLYRSLGILGGLMLVLLLW